jgi:hypothetical protein
MGIRTVILAVASVKGVDGEVRSLAPGPKRDSTSGLLLCAKADSGDARATSQPWHPLCEPSGLQQRRLSAGLVDGGQHQ